MSHLDHLSRPFIPACSGSVVSSDLLAEAVGGSVDLGWHVGLVIVTALPLQGSLALEHPPPPPPPLYTYNATLSFLANQAERSGLLLATWTLTFLGFPCKSSHMLCAQTFPMGSWAPLEK